jgi:hypothetical protein
VKSSEFATKEIVIFFLELRRVARNVDNRHWQLKLVGVFEVGQTLIRLRTLGS